MCEMAQNGFLISERPVNHMPKTPTGRNGEQAVTHDMVVGLVGESGPPAKSMSKGGQRLPLTGMAAQVYDTLATDDDNNDERRWRATLWSGRNSELPFGLLPTDLYQLNMI